MARLNGWLKIVQAVIVAATTSVLTVRQVNQDFRLSTEWTVVVMVALFVAGVIPPTIDGIGRLFQLRRGKLSKKGDQLVKSAFRQIADRCGLDWREIRVGAYLVRRTMRHPVCGIHVRIAQIRLTSHPRSSHVAWTKGKGVIGQCWVTRQPIAQDLSKSFRGLKNGDEVKWMDADSSQTMGFSYEEFRSTKDYGAVVATPIVTKGRYRGCMALDVPASMAAEATTMKKNEILEILQFAADVLGTDLEGD